MAEDERLGIELLLLGMFGFLRHALGRCKSHPNEDKAQEEVFQNTFHALFSLFSFLI